MASARLTCASRLDRLEQQHPDSYRFEQMDYSPPPKPAAGPFRTNLANEIGPLYLSSDRPRPVARCDRLVLDATALAEWKKQCMGSKGSPEGLPKLVVVCTSGGAIRAAYWTATVLERLGREVACETDTFQGDFHKHVRIITGASGGMVGAAYYVSWLRNRLGFPPAPGADELPKDHWARSMPIFSLSPVARSIALRDPIETTFRRAFNAIGHYPDRGRVLERDCVLCGIRSPPCGTVRRRESCPR